VPSGDCVEPLGIHAAIIAPATSVNLRCADERASQKRSRPRAAASAASSPRPTTSPSCRVAPR
jgi:hypothetical protein